MVEIISTGDFDKATKFLNAILPGHLYRTLNKYGQKGCAALRQSTPKRAGRTANSWYYDVKIDKEQAEIIWSNSHTNKGVPIAVVIRYGHGMPKGGYVKGTDFITPAIQPIFEEIKDAIWKEITDA